LIFAAGPRAAAGRLRGGQSTARRQRADVTPLQKGINVAGISRRSVERVRGDARVNLCVADSAQ